MQASYTTMTTLVENACSSSSDVIYELLFPALNALEQSLSQQSMSPDKAKNLQDLLCGLIQVCLVRAGSKVQPDLSGKII